MSARRILIDTGPLVAIIRQNDEHHEPCVRLSRDLPLPLLTCWPVVTEAMWLLQESPDSQQKLLDMFNIGALAALRLDESDVPGLQALLKRYASLRPQLADLCLVQLANRENIPSIFTLDRRDFSVYRFKGRSAFRLLPKD